MVTKKSKDNDVGTIRAEIDRINGDMLELLNQRAALVEKLRPLKMSRGMATYDPVREAEQMQSLLKRNQGPLPSRMVEEVFRTVFRAFRAQQEQTGEAVAPLATARSGKPRLVEVGGDSIGGGKPVIIAGPCAVEDEHSLDALATHLAALGIRFLRGGAFKPRSSPYAFQGLGREGLEVLARTARRHGLRIVSEITSAAHLELFNEHVDLIQVGAHNMFNYDLLKHLSGLRKPILLKRNMAARVEEWLLAAEYLLAGGNDQVVLCERGIRTFETGSRYTLDIAAVGLVKELSDLPVIVDVSHAAGRRDLLLPLARAALAAGADGVMVEVHHSPEVALSDSVQQLSLKDFERFLERLQDVLETNS